MMEFRLRPPEFHLNLPWKRKLFIGINNWGYWFCLWLKRDCFQLAVWPLRIVIHRRA